jgi:cytochrome c-type biogenesis protein CcmH/NrfF
MRIEANVPADSLFVSSRLLSSRAKRGIWVRRGAGEDQDSSSLALLGMTRWFLRPGARLILLALAVFALLGAGDQSARVNDLGHRMMCVCGCNQILLECNHVGCAYSDRMRAELIAAVDRGDNDDMTLQVFVQKYGTTVMAAPTKTGFNRVAWIMPYLVLVLGLTMVTLIVRAWRSRPLVLPVGAVAAVHGAELEHFRDQARKDTEV